jgi:hypothetical protein
MGGEREGRKKTRENDDTKKEDRRRDKYKRGGEWMDLKNGWRGRGKRRRGFWPY